LDLTSTRRAAVLACAALAGLAAVAAHGQVNGDRQTMILSAAPGGGAADGDSDNIAFSQDNREIKYIAFDSSATNLVRGDTNGKRDVFVLVRSKRGDHASLAGRIIRVSVGPRGRQANGDSRLPSIDGQTGENPHCIVFESRATNLARGDRSPDWDIYLYDTRKKRTILVSPGIKDARTGVVDGECELVTFESRGRIYVRALHLRKTYRIARGTNPDQATNGKGVAYERNGQIYYQAYFEKFRSKKKGGPYIKKNGRERLVSANARGRRGNGVSKNPTVDDNGWYVAFESTATNLCEGGRGCPGLGTVDRNGPISDIFRRNLNPRRAPTKEHMAMASYSQGCTAKNPGAKTVDEQGNGPSNNPAMTGAGENIVFDSEATNLRQSPSIRVADGNGPVRDVFYWNFPRKRKCGNVSRESRGEGARGTEDTLNGDAVRPAASNRANFIGFTSTLSGQVGELNGPAIPDVFVRYLGAGPGS